MSVFDGYSWPQESNNAHLAPLSTDSPVPGAPGESQHHQSPWASREEPPVSRAGSSTSPMENWNWSRSGLCSWRGPSGRDLSTSLTIKHGPRSDKKTLSGLLHQCLARSDAPTAAHDPTGGRAIALPWVQPDLSQPRSLKPAFAAKPAFLSSLGETFLMVMAVTKASRLNTWQSRSQGKAPEPPAGGRSRILIPPPTRFQLSNSGSPRAASTWLCQQQHHEGTGKKGTEFCPFSLEKPLWLQVNLGFFFFFLPFFNNASYYTSLRT